MIVYVIMWSWVVLTAIVSYATGYNKGQRDAVRQRTVGTLVVDEGVDKIRMSFIFDDVPMEEILSAERVFVDIDRKQA